MGTVADVAIAINIIADLVMLFKKQGLDITPDNIFDVVAEKEAQKAELNEKLGI